MIAALIFSALMLAGATVAAIEAAFVWWANGWSRFPRPEALLAAALFFCALALAGVAVVAA